MMYNYLKIALPVYFVLYFGIAFVAKSLIIARKIGKSPFVLPKDDSAYGLIGFYFKLTLTALFVYVLLFSFFPGIYECFFPIMSLENAEVAYVGMVILFLAFVLTVIAQNQMKNSWRIGIDTQTPTPLVTTGLFRYSRNPVFLGMTACLVGLFLITPNAATLLFLIVGYILIQIQIRLEEEFLLKQHSEEYKVYRAKTRRMI